MPKISKTELIRLQKQLKTDAAIGEKFGVTRQAVHQLRKKFGVEATTAKNAERNEKILALYSSGKSGTAIADKFGLSVSQTYRIITAPKGKKSKRK